MAGIRLATLVQRLRRDIAAPTGTSDADLLARLTAASFEEDAFQGE